MASDANASRHSVNIGSGRSRLPDTPSFSGLMLGPGYTTTQRNALADAEGLVVYDTTLGQLILNDGTDWVNLDGSALS